MYLLNTFGRGKDKKKRKQRLINRSTKTAIGTGLGGILGSGISKLASKNKKVGLATGLIIGGIAGNIYGKEENKYNKSPLLYKSKVIAKEGYESFRNKSKKTIKKIDKISDTLNNYRNKNLSTFGIINIKQSIRTSKKKGTYVVKAHTRKKKDKLVTVKKAASTFAASIGITTLGYIALKGRYRANMKTTIANAVKKADDLVVDIPVKAKSVTITMPGMSGVANAEDTAKAMGLVAKRYKKGTHVIALENRLFNTNNTIKGSGKEWTTKQIKELPKAMFNTIVNQGRNLEAENMLAHVLAAKKSRPDLDINLFGASGSGNVIHEVSEYLTDMNIKHKGITLGTGYYGLTKPNKSIKSFTNKQDPFTMFTAKWNNTYVEGGKNHDIPSYIKDKTVQEAIKNYFY